MTGSRVLVFFDCLKVEFCQSLEVVPALYWVVEIADCLEDFSEGSGSDPSKVRFQLREGLFDGIQIWRVRRQVEEPAAMVTQGLCCLLVAVGRQVVEDDDGAGGDFGDQYFADVGSKGRAVHRALDDPRSDQGILCQARDQGLGSPTAERRIHR